MNSKTVSIVSYIGLIGWIIAYFVSKTKTDDLSRYHLKQGFGLAIVGIPLVIISNIIAFIIPFVGLTLSSILGLLVFILLVIGIINAANETQKPLPIIGKSFENKFSFIE